MTTVNDDLIRVFLAEEARREVTAAPSLDEAVGRLAPRVAGQQGSAYQRQIVLIAATVLLVAALATAVAVGSGILRLPWVVDSEEPSVDLGIFAPIADRIVYCTDSGLWAVDPIAPSPTPTPVRLEGMADPDGQCASFTEPLGWSSDGTELLFQREDLTSNDLCCPDYLYILRADGTETQLNSDSMYTNGAAIAPDGSRVIFAAGDYRGVDVGLFVVDAEGGQPVRIAQGQEPTFSPDGTQIAYVSYGLTGARVWVANADGSDAHEILAGEPALAEGSFSLAWSPAGDRIAMDNGLEGHVAIYTFAPDGSEFTEVITGGSNPHWSPDGSQIAYGALPGTPGLSIADADGSNARTFDFGASGPWHPGGTPTSVGPSVAPGAWASPSASAAAFPTAVFAGLGEEPVSDELAAELQTVLNDMPTESGSRPR